MKNEEGGREQKKQVLENLVKKKKTEGCHSSTAQAVRLSSGAPSKMQPAPYGLLGSAISREELPACLPACWEERENV